MQHWDLQADVVVVGSGGGALTAAILAHDQGANTVVLERTNKVGGTTACSGGAAWMPMNSHMKELGISDSREEALAYCKKITEGRAADSLVEAYVDNAPKIVDYLESKTPLRFSPMTMPDYHPEEPGGKLGGRALEAKLFNLNELGEWKDKVRSHAIPFMNHQTTEEQFVTYQMMLNPSNMPVDLVLDRMEKGWVGRGNGLIAALLKGCLDRNITILLETRALELIKEDGRVIGVRSQRQGKDFLVKAAGGVVLACGGFEWNEDLKKKHLYGVITHPVSPPFNEGDGTIMAAEVGADMINMHEVWWMQSTRIEGDEYEGKPYNQLCVTERICPHSILVNRRGRRFVNESASYNDISKSHFVVNENGTGYKNLPSWLILDSQYRAKYHVQTICPGDPDPEWLVKDDTLEGLAKKVGIDPAGLAETVARFNSFARQGKDPDFDRGFSAYERYMGDPSAPHPNLGTIEKPPFYAVPMYAGALGTKGGPRTDHNGQVLDVRGRPIGGLYAAGNVMAPVSGPGYYGPGGTIGPGIVFGFLAGRHAAEQAKARGYGRASGVGR
ncbi:MAG: FAD-binding protein [Terriglobales bacterium]